MSADPRSRRPPTQAVRLGLGHTRDVFHVRGRGRGPRDRRAAAAGDRFAAHAGDARTPAAHAILDRLADWIVDLGPGAGHDGGRIVFEGRPADLVAARSTLTGKNFAACVGT